VLEPLKKEVSLLDDAVTNSKVNRDTLKKSSLKSREEIEKLQ
jgi:hypothetical protein